VLEKMGKKTDNASITGREVIQEILGIHPEFSLARIHWS